MSQYLKIPVLVEAFQWTGEWHEEEELPWIIEAMSKGTVHVGRHFVRKESKGDLLLFIDTPKGTMEAAVGDWIIQDANGEIYPCKPDIFAATYEPIEEGK